MTKGLYEIWDKDLKGENVPTRQPVCTYEQFKNKLVDPNNKFYGSKLVEVKRVQTGFCIKVKFLWRKHWYWTPCISWKYQCYFHWLFFMIWIEGEYDFILNSVIRDHLADQEPMET